MVQVIKYSCCEKIFAACREPECYSDPAWLKSIKRSALQGDTIELLESGNVQFGLCECKKKNSITQPHLFSELVDF